MKREDGGSAFPIPLDDRPGAYETHPGMTLRDWFAGKALSGILAESFGCDPNAGIPPPWQPEHAAERAYRMADAMLKARDA